MAGYTAECPYCGQIQMIEGKDNLDKEAISKLAASQCKCEGAENYRKIESKKKTAISNIEELFKSDKKSLKKILLQAVDGLAEQSIKRVAIKTDDGINATLTAKEKSIKVERTETKKDSLES